MQTSNLLLKTREKFADEVGITHKTVYAMCDRGYLPTVRFGRRVFINLIALKRICEVAADDGSFTAPARAHGGARTAVGEGADLLGKTIPILFSQGENKKVGKGDA